MLICDVLHVLHLSGRPGADPGFLISGDTDVDIFLGVTKKSEFLKKKI